MTEREVFKAMMSNDPDGKETEPTEKDYIEFKAWAIRQYGRNAWIAYHAFPWRPRQYS